MNLRIVLLVSLCISTLAICDVTVKNETDSVLVVRATPVDPDPAISKQIQTARGPSSGFIEVPAKGSVVIDLYNLRKGAGKEVKSSALAGKIVWSKKGDMTGYEVIGPKGLAQNPISSIVIYDGGAFDVTKTYIEHEGGVGVRKYSTTKDVGTKIRV